MVNFGAKRGASVVTMPDYRFFHHACPMGVWGVRADWLIRRNAGAPDRRIVGYDVPIPESSHLTLVTQSLSLFLR